MIRDGCLLRLENVGKDYAKVESRGGRLRLVADLLRGHGARNAFTALDGVSLEMSRGESLGVVGDFTMVTSPSSDSMTRSVKVPPISVPI